MNNLIWITIVLVTVLVFINLLITKEILSWVKSKIRIVNLLLVLWCLPFLGAFVVYQKTDISPVWFYNANSEINSSSVVSSSLMEVEAIFNPGVKYMKAEIMQEYKLDEQQENRVGKQDFSKIVISKTT